MKTLYLLRHAKAAAEDPAIADIRRPLTDQGFHDARVVSELLRQQNLVPEKIISSDAVRAYTTAFVFAATFEKISGDIELEGKLYECTVQQFINVIGSISDTFSSCMIVGHNNTISMAANELMEKNLPGLNTCGMYVIASEAMSWSEFDSFPKKILLQLDPETLR